MIVDNNSKFGTLVKMVKPFEILPDKVAVQVNILLYLLDWEDCADFRNENRPNWQMNIYNNNNFVIVRCQLN